MWNNRGARIFAAVIGVSVLLVVLLEVFVPHGGKVVGGRTFSDSGIADPVRSVDTPSPNYLNACAPTGLDNGAWCLTMSLAAIDHARAVEHVKPMLLPADFGSLDFSSQMLVVVDAERTDRGLSPFTGTVTALNRLAAQGARVDDLPPSPGTGYRGTRRDFDGGFLNGLDLDFQWMYDDGPGSGTDGCAVASDPGCWADRHVLLGRYPSGDLELGAAVDPTGDTNSDDVGGPAGAVVLTSVARAANTYAYRWSEAQALVAQRALSPMQSVPVGYSLTGIPDPPHTEHAAYAASCSSHGIDTSQSCTGAVLAAIDQARAREHVKPMMLPADFSSFTIAEQLFVVVNMERIDRGLAPFAGMTASMNSNASKGAASGSDPPNPEGVTYDDELWSGGSVSALDADYGWMYDDGRGSGNLDCARTGGSGCWDHRHGILDNFGTAGFMELGAAFDPTGDTAVNGDAGGTSMALTLAVVMGSPPAYTFMWKELYG